MRAMRKFVMFEWRRPITKLEKSCYGVTDDGQHNAKVFFNTTIGKNDMVDTFFHEMTHVFFGFVKNNVPSQKQEKLARKIGALCKEALR